MLKKTLVRSAAAAVTTALVAGAGIIVLAPSAQAADLGTVTLNPVNGNINSLITASSDGPCAAPATKVKVRVDGFGLPASGLSAVSPTAVGFSTSSPMSLPLSNSFLVYANNNATALVGDYTVKIQCVNNLGTTIYDEYDMTMNWVTPGNNLANIDSATYTTVVNSVATTTTLATSVPSPQDEGTAITLTATVDGGATDPNAGTVEFFRGATSLGTSPVSGGVATLPGVLLPEGSNSLTAVFSGTSGFDASTSAAVPFTITNVVVATTTTIAVNGSGAQYSPVTIDATVVPNNAVGQVRFFDGATQIGAVALASGTASFTVPSPALGSHSYSAEFVPTNPADFDGSTSATEAYEVVASTGVIENITTTVPAGALTISVLDDGAVLLPAALAADGSSFGASGAMDPVRVVDTRSGSFGWTANGQLAPFFQGGNASIAAENLGWAPSVTSTSNALMTVNAGAVIAPADAVAINAGTGAGLATQRVLASAPAGSSVGTAELGAVLTLKAPTTTATGTHTAVLTLTAI